MQIKDLNNKYFKIITSNHHLNKPIKDFYCCDLLSFVLGRVREANTVLLTIINSINVVAVASLLEMSAVIFCDGVIPNREIIDKAEEENIILLYTELSSAQALKVIYESFL